ncbi:MAG TPA: ArsA family ATPase [Candidatus Binataceae bacterium]|nr:ArsA family ATPase [Candidatus Binataceae bacterium]
MLNELLERRVIILLGKGGVGKSTVSAALARCAANRGLRTLVMETDSRAPMAAALGVDASFSPIEAGPGLSAMVLDGGRALDEYLGLVLPGRAVLKAVFASRLYQFFVQTAPGLRELMMLGKIYYEAQQKTGQRRRWDLIVLDAPASGQALSLLRMPTAARATFASSIVGQEAEHIGRMLRDAKTCAIVEVTTPETLALSELIETHKALDAIDLHPAAIFLNRVSTVAFDSPDVTHLVRRADSIGAFRHLGHLVEIARAEIERAAQSPRARTEILRHTPTPVAEIPDLAHLEGSELVDHLASFFTSSLNVHSVRHGAA